MRKIAILLSLITLLSCKKDTEVTPGSSIIELSYQLSSSQAEAGVNDTIYFRMSCLNDNKATLSIVWQDKTSGKIIRTIETSTNKLADSVGISWTEIGNKVVVNTIKFKNDIVLSKEIAVGIVEDKMTMYLPAPIEVELKGDMVNVSASIKKKYGKVINTSWDFDGKESRYNFISVTNKDTSFIFDHNVYVYCKATDEDGFSILDSVKVSFPVWTVKNSFTYNWECVENKVVSIGDMAYISFCDGLASYNFKTGTSTLLPNMPKPSSSTGGNANYSLSIYKDKLYILGGDYRQGVGKSNDGLIYDLATGSYTRYTLPYAFLNCVSEVIGDNLYIVTTQQLLYKYNFSTEAWTIGTSMPEPITHATSVVYNNNLYVIGGRNLSNASSSSVYLYDTDKNSWSRLPDLPQAGAFGTGTVYKDKIYVFRGEGVKTNEMNFEYDFSKNTWRTISTSSVLNNSVSNKCVSSSDGIYIFTAEGKVVKFNPENDFF